MLYASVSIHGRPVEAGARKIHDIIAVYESQRAVPLFHKFHDNIDIPQEACFTRTKYYSLILHTLHFDHV